MDVTQLAKLAKTFVKVDSDPEEHGGSAAQLLGIDEIRNVSAKDATPASYVFEKPSDTSAKQAVELFSQFIASSCKTIPTDATAATIQTALTTGPLAKLVKEWRTGKKVTLPSILDLSIDHLVMAPRAEVARGETRPLLAPPSGKGASAAAIGHSNQYRMCLRALSFLDREIAKSGGKADPKLLTLRQGLGGLKAGLETTPIPEAAFDNKEPAAVALVDAVTLFLTYKKKNVDKIYNYTAEDGAIDANQELFGWDDSAKSMHF